MKTIIVIKATKFFNNFVFHNPLKHKTTDEVLKKNSHSFQYLITITK